MPAPPNKMLSEMLTALRAECGHSTNVAHGLNDRAAMVYLLDRTQLDLADSYDWPFLTVDRDALLAPGQRYYDYAADLDYADIDTMWVIGSGGNEIYTLGYDITPANFLEYNSMAGAQSWPPRRWRHNADLYQAELWPIPDTSATGGRIRMRGVRTMQPLNDDSDIATLPWRIIVLVAAAEVLAAEQDAASQTKSQRAAELIRRLKVRSGSHKSGVTPMGQTHGHGAPRIGLEYIPSGYGQGPKRN